jgi:iron complex transport system ATP-binding protein
VTDDPTIAVDGVSVTLGDVPVLSDVSLDVAASDLVGLVGPNGAGKTTLLRTISGALAPDRGEVRVGGEDVHALSSKGASRRVAVVPQDTSVSFSFSVREVVAMARYPHRSRFETATTDDRSAVERALERTNVADLADRTVEEISGGERQRVLLARAVAQETPALLLDEPTASLDVNHQVETLELVRSLVDEGTAAVAAIHDLGLAARYCDALALLSDGDIVATGPPSEVLTESAVAAAFDVRSVVDRDPATGALSVTALPDRAAPRGTRVHVVGGGTAAARTLSALDDAGFDLSAGPLSETDIAAATARSLGADVVTTTPLSSPTAEERTAATERARTADVAVLVPPGDATDSTRAVADAAPVRVDVAASDAGFSSSTSGATNDGAVPPGDAPAAISAALDPAGEESADSAPASASDSPVDDGDRSDHRERTGRPDD